jgi:hypothetical protein
VNDEHVGASDWDNASLAGLSTLPFCPVSFARGGLVESIREG